jgi:tRNA (mo5U34)-methyltransferase
MANRHEQRRRYIFEPLLTLTGGSLRGCRVLDLGCNAGYWSLLAAEAHADFVLGVDAREVHIEQANLVFEAKGLDRSRYRFEQGNLFRHPIEGRYDVVLCLGLLDHVAKPVELFDVMARSGPELIRARHRNLALQGERLRRGEPARPRQRRGSRDGADTEQAGDL